MGRMEIDNSPAMSDLPAKGFLELPRELRDLVYSYAVVARAEDGAIQPRIALSLQFCLRRCKREVLALLEGDPTKWPEFTNFSPNINVGLLCTSRQIRLEAEEVLYKENVFVMDPKFHRVSLWRCHPRLNNLIESNVIRRAVPAYASDQLTNLHCRMWRGTRLLGADSGEGPSINLTDEAAIHEIGIRSQLGPLLILPPPEVTNIYNQREVVVSSISRRRKVWLDSCDILICRIAALPNLRKLYMDYHHLWDSLRNYTVHSHKSDGMIEVILGRLRDALEARETRGLPAVDVHVCGTTLKRLNEAHEWKHWSLLGCRELKCAGLVLSC